MTGLQGELDVPTGRSAGLLDVRYVFERAGEVPDEVHPQLDAKVSWRIKRANARA